MAPRKYRGCGVLNGGSLLAQASQPYFPFLTPPHSTLVSLPPPPPPPPTLPDPKPYPCLPPSPNATCPLPPALAPPPPPLMLPYLEVADGVLCEWNFPLAHPLHLYRVCKVSDPTPLLAVSPVSEIALHTAGLGHTLGG